MKPENLEFGGGSGLTVLHPLVALETVVAVILILSLSRRRAIAPLLLPIFVTPMGQVVVLGGVHLTVARILILTGIFRYAVSGSRSSVRLFGKASSSVDVAFAVWVFVSFSTFSLRWLDAEALVKGAGTILDSLGAYIVLRYLIQDEEDILHVVKLFGLIAMLVGACMLNEQVAGKNVFSLLGGLPSMAVRDGQIRSQGAFEIYITAGVFGATLVPLLVWLWSRGSKERMAAFLGMTGATVMAVTCSSSTAPLAYVGGLVGLCCWPLRRHMRAVRWLLALGLVSLQLIMKAPVWALIARVDLTGSSSGYHRYMLVDTFIRHFRDWWLLGTNNNGNWGWDMWDLCNQYIACGLQGGLTTLLSFLAIIYRGFAELGRARKLPGIRKQQTSLLWCLGAAMAAHLVAYFGVSYFDQMQFAWYALLAMIAAAVSPATRPPVVPVYETRAVFV